MTLVYPELRRIAARYLRQERPGHTLRPTGLVHEVYMRLFGREHANWQNRAHFFGAVAREMRHLLVDYARARNAKKRADGNVRISLDDVHATADARTRISWRSMKRSRDWNRSTPAPAGSSSCGSSPA